MSYVQFYFAFGESMLELHYYAFWYNLIYSYSWPQVFGTADRGAEKNQTILKLDALGQFPV